MLLLNVLVSAIGGLTTPLLFWRCASCLASSWRRETNPFWWLMCLRVRSLSWTYCCGGSPYGQNLLHFTASRLFLGVLLQTCKHIVTRLFMTHLPYLFNYILQNPQRKLYIYIVSGCFVYFCNISLIY